MRLEAYVTDSGCNDGTKQTRQMMDETQHGGSDRVEQIMTTARGSVACLGQRHAWGAKAWWSKVLQPQVCANSIPTSHHDGGRLFPLFTYPLTAPSTRPDHPRHLSSPSRQAQSIRKRAAFPTARRRKILDGKKEKVTGAWNFVNKTGTKALPTFFRSTYIYRQHGAQSGCSGR